MFNVPRLSNAETVLKARNPKSEKSFMVRLKQKPLKSMQVILITFIKPAVMDFDKTVGNYENIKSYLPENQHQKLVACDTDCHCIQLMNLSRIEVFAEHILDSEADIEVDGAICTAANDFSHVKVRHFFAKKTSLGCWLDSPSSSSFPSSYNANAFQLCLQNWSFWQDWISVMESMVGSLVFKVEQNGCHWPTIA